MNLQTSALGAILVVSLASMAVAQEAGNAPAKPPAKKKLDKVQRSFFEATIAMKNWRRLHLKQQAQTIKFKALNTELVNLRAIEKKAADAPEVKALNQRVAAIRAQLQNLQRQAAFAFTIAGRAVEAALVYQPKQENLHVWRAELFATLANSGQSIGYSNDKSDTRLLSFQLFRKGLESARIAHLARPKDPNRALVYARLSMAFHDYKATESVLQDLVKRDQAKLRERVLLATCFYYQNKFAEAQSVLAELPEVAKNRKHVKALLEVIESAIVDWNAEQKLRDAAKSNPLVKLTIGGNATVTLELFAKSAPESAANFLALCKSQFYLNSSFHRVLANFIAQTGIPPKSTASKKDPVGPGYRIKPNLKNGRKHFRGSLVMATQGSERLAGSQFYISMVPLPYLNGEAQVFGAVVEGMDVLDQLRGNEKITRIEILRDAELPAPTKIAIE